MPDWIDSLIAGARAGNDCVLVSVAETKGSAPRDIGAKMLVTASAVHDSIGGGDLEMKAIGLARDMLANPGARAVRHFPLGAELGQVCGGRVDLVFEWVGSGARWPEVLHEQLRHGGDFVIATNLGTDAEAEGKLFVAADRHAGSLGASALDERAIEAAREMLAGSETTRWLDRPGSARAALPVLLDAIRSPDFDIVLFGAGHVGTALVDVMSRLPCRITWVDSRPGQFPGTIPSNVRAVLTDRPPDAVDAAPPGAYFLVMTHSHDIDRELAERILARADFRYFGLMGSATKRRQFERHLAAHGIPTARIAHMVCPVGVAGIRGKQPAVIAVAVAAQLLQRRDGAADGTAAEERALA